MLPCDGTAPHLLDRVRSARQMGCRFSGLGGLHTQFPAVFPVSATRPDCNFVYWKRDFYFVSFRFMYLGLIFMRYTEATIIINTAPRKQKCVK